MDVVPSRAAGAGTTRTSGRARPRSSASAEHRELFAADPDKYAPRFGGFCAMGMSLGKQAQADPEAWAIVDDKLYLTFSQPALAKFTVDTPTHISKAETEWEQSVQGN